MTPFWTGSPHMPKNSQIEYQVNVYQRDSRQLPVAHTCSYTLDIPSYEQFKERFIRALEEGIGFALG